MSIARRASPSVTALAWFGAATGAGCGASDRRSEPAYPRNLQPRLDALIKDMRIPAAVVVLRSSQLGDWSATFGHRTTDGTEPVRLADHFRIASNTKTMTGTVILQLGRVDNGERIARGPRHRRRDSQGNHRRALQGLAAGPRLNTAAEPSYAYCGYAGEWQIRKHALGTTRSETHRWPFCWSNRTSSLFDGGVVETLCARLRPGDTEALLRRRAVRARQCFASGQQPVCARWPRARFSEPPGARSHRPA